VQEQADYSDVFKMVLSGSERCACGSACGSECVSRRSGELTAPETDDVNALASFQALSAKRAAFLSAQHSLMEKRIE
jgi:hypothetical protein